MKKIVTLIILIATITSYGQEGVIKPLNTWDAKSGTYLKDINNELNPYIGTWEGTWANKKFSLKIEKLLKVRHTSENGFYNYEDKLIGRYKVINLSDGSVLEDNFGQQNLSLIKIESTSSKRFENRFNFIYIDKDLCSIVGEIVFIGNPATNQLQYNFMYDEWDYNNCQYPEIIDIPVKIPTIYNLIMTRQ